jgi:hypothetical protein
MTNLIENYKKWNGKNYNGVIYISNEKITDTKVLEKYTMIQNAEIEFLDWMRANNADKKQQLTNFIITERKEMIVRFFISFGKPIQSEGIGKEIANATYDYFLKGKEMNAVKVAKYVVEYFKF